MLTPPTQPLLGGGGGSSISWRGGPQAQNACRGLFGRIQVKILALSSRCRALVPGFHQTWHRTAGMEQILTPPDPNQSTPPPPRLLLSFTLSSPLAPFSNILFHPLLPAPAFVLLSVSVRLFSPPPPPHGSGGLVRLTRPRAAATRRPLRGGHAADEDSAIY